MAFMRVSLAFLLLLGSCAVSPMKRYSGLYVAKRPDRRIHLRLSENGVAQLRTTVSRVEVSLEKGRWTFSPDGSIGVLLRTRNGADVNPVALSFRPRAGELKLNRPEETRYGEFGLSFFKQR